MKSPALSRAGARVRRSLAIWLGLLGAAVFGAAASTPPVWAAQVDALFASWDKPDRPGVMVGIAQDGVTVHARGYGCANLEQGIPLTAETVSESGSVAKQFTAAAVTLLAVRGKLSLDDPIRRHLPELPAPLAAAITVRYLLNHTSGLRDIHGLFDLLGRPSYTSAHDNAEVVRVMSRQRRLNFAPGTEYLYCNASYILAAVIVERVSGRPFPEFCEREIFRPRGMNHTRWRDDFAAIVPGRAAAYAPRREGGFRLDTPASNLVGNGGLLTTVGDLLRWNASLDAPEGEWIEVVRQLQAPARLQDGRTLDYGLGLVVDELAGQRQISHGGATSGYRTYLARFPERGVSIAVLANVASFDATSAARNIARLVLDLPPPPAVARVTRPAEELAACAGLYHCALTDDVVRVSVRAGRVFFDDTALAPTGPRAFSSAQGRTSYVWSAEGAGPARTVTLNSASATRTYQAVAPVRPSPADLAVYVGTYYSEELGVEYRVEVRGGRLVFAHWPAAPVPAEPSFADGFWVTRAWHVTFKRDAGGQIGGLEMTNGRCRRVAFIRR